jgi:protein-S-isoprenylcysteine O-methyltransferase Ste14
MDWLNVWVYLGFMLVFKTMGWTLLIIKDPGLVNERGRFIKRDTKAFDKIFFSLWIPLHFILLIIAGLDAGRFEWTRLSYTQNLIGAVMMFIGFSIVFWAMLVNTHFEATVRIQDDRQHQVCTAGPYRIIRHPGYTGAILGTIGSTMLLGSAWALIPAGLIMLVFIIRTGLEDRTLQIELTGYEEYATNTRYRLMPFVW